MIAAGLDLTCDYNPAKMGVMTHEYLHTFFLIDLYDTRFAGLGLGNYDIMSYPYGVNNDGYIPAHLSAWAKQTIEWLECETNTKAGEYTLQPAAVSPSCYKVLLSNFDPTQQEYILLENRQQTNFDVNFWKAGLVMYHIDDHADDQRQVGYPGDDNGFPTSGNHYRVAVIQADGNYDLEKWGNLGDAGDIWEPGMKLKPNDPTGGTWPNTDSYQYGNVQRTGITIEVLEPEGQNVRVKIDFDNENRGVGGPIFATPPRDQEDHSNSFNQQLADLADNQFVVPDDPDHGISGMIPQLGWFDKFRKQPLQGTVQQSNEEPQVTVQGEEELLDGSFVFAATGATNHSGAGGNWQGPLGFVTTALLVAYQLFF